MNSSENNTWLKKIVDRIAYSLPEGSYDHRDLMSAAYIGMLEAKERFDKSLGVPFQKFAYLRVRGAVIDQVRKECFLSVSASKHMRLRARIEEKNSKLS